MKEDPDSLSVPYNFARCFNDQCSQASKCLRHIAAQYNGADYLYITSVNPARYPADGNQCECFKTAVKVHVTWDLNGCLTGFLMKTQSVSDHSWWDTMGKQDITDSIVENEALCPKIKLI